MFPANWSSSAVGRKLTSVVSAWNTSAPMIAPIGSMVVPSHPRIAVSRRPGRARSSSGATTVGPETMRIAPSITAAREESPSNSHASSPAPAQVIGTPRRISRRTTRWLWPSSSLKLRSRPPSNKMTATARLTIGANAAPNSSFGSTVSVIAPATNPTGSSTTMAGRRSVVAATWQPTASTIRSPSPTKTSELVIHAPSHRRSPPLSGGETPSASPTVDDVT